MNFIGKNTCIRETQRIQSVVNGHRLHRATQHFQGTSKHFGFSMTHTFTHQLVVTVTQMLPDQLGAIRVQGHYRYVNS